MFTNVRMLTKEWYVVYLPNWGGQDLPNGDTWANDSSTHRLTFCRWTIGRWTIHLKIIRRNINYFGQFVKEFKKYLEGGSPGLVVKGGDS